MSGPQAAVATAAARRVEAATARWRGAMAGGCTATRLACWREVQAARARLREEQGLQKNGPGTVAGAEGGARSPRNGGEVARG